MNMGLLSPPIVVTNVMWMIALAKAYGMYHNQCSAVKRWQNVHIESYNSSILYNVQCTIFYLTLTTSPSSQDYRTAPLVTLAISALISFSASCSAFPSSYFLWAFASDIYDLGVSTCLVVSPDLESPSHTQLRAVERRKGEWRR